MTIKKAASILSLSAFALSLLYSCNKNAKYFAVTFQNYDGSILEKTEVKEGNIPNYSGSTPIKEKDNDYVYKYKSWDKELEPIYKDTTYTATFRSIDRCKVIWIDGNDEIIKEDDTDAESIKYTGTVPSKNNEGDKYYYFTGWEEKKSNAFKEITYKAKFNECKVDDDRDYDGLPDYLDPAPLDNAFKVDMSFTYSGDLPTVTVNNAKFNYNYKSLFIDGDNTKYNVDLAKLGTLVNCENIVTTYGKVKVDEEITPKKTYSNIFEKLGFDNATVLETKKEDYALDKNDQSIAVVNHKVINGKDYTSNIDDKHDLFFITLKYRPLSDTSGWESNIDIGADDEGYFDKEGYEHEQSWLNNKQYHKGFYIAASRIKPLLDKYINDNKKESSKPIIFMSGHSRAGSIANILGDMFNKENDSKLFVYTYGTANTYFGSDDNNKNIFNIANTDDFIALSPFSFWTDQNGNHAMRHGVDKCISLGSSLYAKYRRLTGSNYSYVRDIIETIKDTLTFTREDMYTMNKIVRLKKNKAIYISALKKVNPQLTDKQLNTYFIFQEIDGNLFVNFCFASLLNVAIGLSAAGGGSIPSGIEKDALLEIVDEYYNTGLQLFLNGLNSTESVAIPHYITSYYVIANFIE